MLNQPILIVEDDRDIRENLQLLLEIEGYLVLAVTNGREALELLTIDKDTPKPALVFLDLMMPIMDGVTFLKHVETNHKIKNLPIVVLSAASSEKLHSTNMKLVSFMRKPLDIDVLLKTVADYCGPPPFECGKHTANVA